MSHSSIPSSPSCSLVLWSMLLSKRVAQPSLLSGNFHLMPTGSDLFHDLFFAFKTLILFNESIKHSWCSKRTIHGDPWLSTSPQAAKDQNRHSRFCFLSSSLPMQVTYRYTNTHTHTTYKCIFQREIIIFKNNSIKRRKRIFFSFKSSPSQWSY